MKLKYLFMAMITSLVFVACANDDDTLGKLDDIQLSETYVTIPENGGSVTVTVKSAYDWSFQSNLVMVDGQCNIKSKGKDKDGNPIDVFTPCWYNISAISGTVGETEITITAPAFNGGHEATLYINAGNSTQFINIRQGDMKAETATCAEVIAGPEGKTYRVKGTVANIANTTYGNWDLVDETGQILIYGTLDKNGNEKNFASLGIEAGDIVEVEGPKKVYGTTVELEKVTVLKITKSLVKCVSEEQTVGKNGGSLEVKVAYKGKGAYLTVGDDCADWVSYKETETIAGVPTKIEKNPADTAVFKLNVMPNAGGERKGTLTFKSSSSTVSYTFTQEGSIIEAPIADFLAAANKNTVYRVTGTVTGITDMTKGRFTISDYSGEVYVFNCNLNGNELKLGDIVTLTGKYDKYKETEEIVSGVVENVVAVKEVSIADFRGLEDNKSVYYMLTGKIVKPSEANTKWDLETYGNFALQDENGDEIYVYGLTSGWGGPSKQFGKLGLTEGSIITIIGNHASYKGLQQVGSAFLYKVIMYNADK